MCTVKFDNIQVQFGEQFVFNNFSEKIEKGEKIVLSGESGSGKTTLMNCILGFVPTTKGKIFVNGKQVIPENIIDIRKETSWLPQELSFDMQTCNEHL
ncbi:MAG: ATP-binding cassette domain-containing protein, partial [Gallicola sp.]|nr:ATP-binding cassette domain-containing protein [Gallicola sp.]